MKAVLCLNPEYDCFKSTVYLRINFILLNMAIEQVSLPRFIALLRRKRMKQNPKILIIDDDQALHRGLYAYLAEARI
jgi:hypothetical protein